VDLADGDDYISYDLFDFKTKLRRILDDPDEIDRVRNNGRQVFAEGLNYKKSADQLVKFLKGG
jgi:glycosyltransferase involved in cell wall biosynthesis